MAAEQSQNLASSSRPAQGQTDARVVLHMNMKTKILFKKRGGQTDAGASYEYQKHNLKKKKF